MEVWGNRSSAEGARESERRGGWGAWRGFPPLYRGWSLGRGYAPSQIAPSPENFSLLTLENAHFGGYLTHSDVEVVVCCAQDAARLCDRQILSIFIRQAAVHGGLAPLSPDRSAHVCPLSPPTLPLPSLSLPFLLLPRQIGVVFNCSYDAACSL